MSRRQDQLRTTIVEFLSPALPILPRSKTKINSLYSNLEQLPDFKHKEDEEYQLQEQPGEECQSQQDNSYSVYCRQGLEKYDFQTKQRQKAGRRNMTTHRENVLKFQSNFESGNLERADKVLHKQNYNLTLQNDINTSGYTQWFFFSVQQGKKNIDYKFSIVNCHRDASLYQQGMKILVYSSKRQEINKKGWFRGGEKIRYYHEKRRLASNKGGVRMLYTLSFHFKFEFNDDKVYFAYNYPYTAKDLFDDLGSLECKYMSRTTLCRTLAQNTVELVTITNPESTSQKTGIIMTARVHPSETVSSYVIKGVMEFLTSDNEVAARLRDRFIFKIVPMVNPDGVIHGHSRTNLSGRDLNRVWADPDKFLHSEIYHLKKHIIEFSRRCPISMYCDFHGHSNKKNAFLYGCTDSEVPLKTRQFPYLYSKTLNTISFQNCCFRVQNSKAGTARVVLWKALRTHNIFTLETSSCGPSGKNIHFSYKHFQEIGRVFCLTLLAHLCDSESNHILLKEMYGINLNRQQILQQLYQKKPRPQDENTSDSDNSEEDCYDPVVRQRPSRRYIPKSHSKPKTQLLTTSKEKEVILTRKKSHTNTGPLRRSREKTDTSIINSSTLIKPKLFSIQQSQLRCNQAQKQKLSNSIFRSKNITSFYHKPVRMRTIEPICDLPLNRKHLCSFDWTIADPNNIKEAQNQILLKTRKSFFSWGQPKGDWRHNTTTYQFK